MNASRVTGRGVFALSLSLVLVGVLTGEPLFPTDAMTNEELRTHRNAKVAELEKRARESTPETGSEGTLYRHFFCTVYYTPKESGFTAERGFDVTPVAPPGLRGRTFARSFLKAVRREGFGRMREPVNGRHYLQYVSRNRYRYAAAPLGSRGNVLVPRKSCAISTKNPWLRQRMKLEVDSPAIREVFQSTEWEVADVGGGVHPLQIDLYWGEDEPLGAEGRLQARPAGTRFEYDFDILVVSGSPANDTARCSEP
jgi:hypothetical protein